MALNGPATSVRVILGGLEVFVVEEYHVQLGMLTQPAAFSVRLGNSYLARDLMRRYPPNTLFELQIANTTQFIGRTDGWTVDGSAGGTVLTLRGRDRLAPLHDAFVTSEKSYSGVSYNELTRSVLREVYGAGNYLLISSNDSNRSAIAGSKAKAQRVPGYLEATWDTLIDAGKALAGIDEETNTAPATKTIQVRLGQRWYADFLKPQLDRAGLFLWAAGDGAFVLSTANAAQDPLYAIRHRRGSAANIVKSVTHKNEPTARYSRCEVWGRRGGGAEARSRVVGRYEDAEMVALGYDKPLVLPDDKATTVAQAEFLARRKVAEARRAAWSLTYTVAGHTTPAIGGGTAVWVPDTVALVQDDELGIDGTFYVESVEHRGAPQTETTITLMRPEDVVFATEWA